jgi:aspartate/methionine/tyrosine aminotransferase
MRAAPEAVMPYPALPHLEWSKRLTARIYLSGSAAPTPPPQVLGLDRKSFPGASVRDKNPWYLLNTDKGDHVLQGLVGQRLGVAPARVVPVCGASEGHFLIEMLVRGRDGGDVLAESPGYGPHAGVARAFPGVVVPIARDAHGRLDLSVLDSPESGRAKVALVSDPHNPSGQPLEREDMAALVHWGDQRRAQIVVDEVFRETDPTRPPGTWATEWPHRVWSISGLTKAYGLGGLRLGWVVAPADCEQALRRIQDYTSVIAPGPSIVLARQVLERADTARAWVLEAMRPNREYFAARGGWETAGTTAFVRIAPMRGNGAGPLDTAAFCADLLHDHGVAVVPGTFFGAPDGFRIGFGTAPRDFRQGWTIVRKELAKRKWRIVPVASALHPVTTQTEGAK